MKGVILAGGTGTRLRPLTNVINKHLLPVYNKPLIYYPVHALVEAGIKDILIISGTEHYQQIRKLLNLKKDKKAKFTYAIQNEPRGIAHGLGLAESFVNNDLVALILGDNIYEESMKRPVEEFKEQKRGAKIIIKKVPDPQRFGVIEFENRKIKKIEEKPKRPKTNYIVTGFYLYDSNVFDIIKTLKPSKRNEYEITDVNNAYLNRGELNYYITNKEWIDAGTFDSLLKASNFIKQKETV
ncbi:MAG: NTP transferase domain-containing protein [Candidatus Portnoybacteria bacterium]|nr:NTP transferase domain-containing protein [Candidatus Portnoybacteria bacterium]